MEVRLCDLERNDGVDRAVFPALDPHLFARRVAEDDVLLRHAERLEIGPEIRAGRVEVQDARDTDPDAAQALFGGRAAPSERARGLDAAQAEEAALDDLVLGR